MAKKYVVIKSDAKNLEANLNDACDKGWTIFQIIGPVPASGGSQFLLVLEAKKRPEIPVAPTIPVHESNSVLVAPPTPVRDPVSAIVELDPNNPPPPYFAQESTIVREVEDVRCECGEYTIRGTQYCGLNGCIMDSAPVDTVLEQLLQGDEDDATRY